MYLNGFQQVNHEAELVTISVFDQAENVSLSVCNKTIKLTEGGNKIERHFILRCSLRSKEYIQIV